MRFWRIGIISGLSGIAVGISAMLASYPWVLLLWIVATTSVSVAASLRHVMNWYLGFFINVLCLVSAQYPFAIVQHVVLVFFLLGLLQVGLHLYVRHARSTRLQLANTLKSLNALSQSILVTYVSVAPDSDSQEKSLHEARLNYLSRIKVLRQYRKKNSDAVLSDVENIYEIILSLGSLFYRVEDKSTFLMAQQEFTALARSLFVLLQAAEKSIRANTRITVNTDNLNASLLELEEINQTAIQVVAVEPLVFMLFIRDGYELSQVLQRAFANWNARSLA